MNSNVPNSKVQKFRQRELNQTCIVLPPEIDKSSIVKLQTPKDKQFILPLIKSNLEKKKKSNKAFLDGSIEKSTRSKRRIWSNPNISHEIGLQLRKRDYQTWKEEEHLRRNSTTRNLVDTWYYPILLNSKLLRKK